MILLESLFEDVSTWEEVDSKTVKDFDDFDTDYTWYTNGEKHVFVFGDKDAYGPEDEDWDWEVEINPDNEDESYARAKEWFDNYKGFEEAEFDESLTTSEQPRLIEGYTEEEIEGIRSRYKSLGDCELDKDNINKYAFNRLCNEKGLYKENLTRILFGEM